jgi:two-component system KDP operon response regulator KdpE
MSERAGTVLVIDNKPGVRRAMRGALTTLGYIADEASSFEQGLDLARRHRYDSVLLDIDMPGMGGIEACRELRRRSARLGIVMLTVRDGEDEKVEALEAGADDYLIKPFAMRELTARLRAIQRGHATVDRAPSEEIAVGEIALDPERRTVTKRGAPLHLTPKEFEVLEFLMRHAGVPVRHSALLAAVWGGEYGNEVEYLRTFVRQLRKKIEDDPARPHYLTTEAFIGYRFVAK